MSSCRQMISAPECVKNSIARLPGASDFVVSARCRQLKDMIRNVRSSFWADFENAIGVTSFSVLQPATSVTPAAAAIMILPDNSHAIPVISVAIARYGRASTSTDGSVIYSGLHFPPYEANIVTMKRIIDNIFRQMRISGEIIITIGKILILEMKD